MACPNMLVLHTFDADRMALQPTVNTFFNDFVECGLVSILIGLRLSHVLAVSSCFKHMFQFNVPACSQVTFL